VLGFEHHPAGALAGVGLEAHAAGLGAPRGPLGAHGHQGAHAPLVARAARLDPLAQPGFFFRQLLVELLLPHRLGRQPFLLAAQEAGVVARPRREAATIQLDDPRRDVLQEDAVVGHEHHRARVGGEERLQPRHRLDVEMVRGLVEEQQPRLTRERARQQHPPAPAARQRGSAGIGGQAQTIEHHLDLLFEAPSVALLELVLQRAEPLEMRRGGRLRHRDRRVVIGGDQVREVADAVGDDVEHRPLVEKRRHPAPGGRCPGRAESIRGRRRAGRRPRAR
jgi:hypothetical protein